MNREALARILNRSRGTGIVALADPPNAGTQTDPVPWELLSHPQDPRERLTCYLDAWASMNEAVWPEANVRALYEDIMDIFRDHPEADGWFREWRAAHPEGRW
jgi:hypothetical protein